MKISLLEWEKELSKTVDACVGQGNNESAHNSSPKSKAIFRHPELDVSFLASGDTYEQHSVRKTSSLKSLERSSRDSTPSGTPKGQRRVIGPSGSCLERQGSGAKLYDMLSNTRPGTLPPLNININPPIPRIGERIASADDIHSRLKGYNTKTPNNSVCSTPESDTPCTGLTAEPDPEAKIKEEFFRKYVADDRKVISHPSRKFFSKKSATLEMGEIINILSANSKKKCLPHVGEYGYGS